jgi:N-methylhydantoinase B
MKGKGKQFVPHGGRVDMAFPGGAGYGEPQERAREAVRRDLALGYITPGFAIEHYGMTQEDIDAVLAQAKRGEEF